MAICNSEEKIDEESGVAGPLPQIPTGDRNDIIMG